MRVDVELHGIFGAAADEPGLEPPRRMIELAKGTTCSCSAIVRGTPGWLSECPAAASRPVCARRATRKRGASLAGEVAAHARGSIDHWEILNEPDARWAFLGSAEDYARMLSASYDAIKARTPEAKVVFGGVERPREHDWVNRVFATPGADAAQKFDIAAIHLRLRLRNEVGRWPSG